MSYILNALRKSEQQRRAGQAPSLETSILESPQQKKKWLRWVIAGLICLNVIALINLSFFQSDKPDASKNISVADAADPQAGNQPGKILPKPKVQSAANQPEKPNTKTPPSSTTQQSPSIADMIDSERSPPENRPSTVIPEESVQAEQLPDSVDPVQAQQPDERATQDTRVSQKKGDSTNKREPQINENDQAPMLSDMPPEFRRRVPRLNINVFVFADDPAERFVIIELKKYKMNQQIAEGLQLEDILSDSILVRFEGKAFRIKRP